jgi:TolB-like protein/Tfp pilus assembly protein PilF
MSESASNKPGGKRLDSWKEIAAHLQKDVRTVQRWEKNERLPVHRKPHDKLASVYAYESELDAWWNQGSHPEISPSDSSGLSKRPTLVVLPLRNLSGDPEQEYFSDGLTEELIGQIGRIDPNQLGVIARASAMRFKNSTKGIDQIARELGVSYALEASVRRDANRIRVLVALIRVSDQTSLWSESYDRDLRDILEVQTEVARAVAKEIAVKISTAEQARLARSGPVDPEAYSAYLRGRFFWNRRSAEAIRKAIAQFEDAISRDPRYAPAHTGIADCYSALSSIQIGALAPNEAMPKAIAAAGKALELDPTLAEAHTSLGYARFWYEWNWPAAERCFKRALELNPAYATARQWHAAYLQTLDRVDESLAEIDRALELDPLSIVFRTAREASLYLERRYDDVIAESTRTLEMDPGFVLAYFSLGRAYTHKKMHRQAIAELKKAHQLSGESPAMTMQLGYAYAMAGKKPEAKKMLDALTRLARKNYVPAFYFAGIYAGLRDKEHALGWLKKAYAERCDYMVFLPKEPAADSVRDDPRFDAVVPTPRKSQQSN